MANFSRKTLLTPVISHGTKRGKSSRTRCRKFSDGRTRADSDGAKKFRQRNGSDPVQHRGQGNLGFCCGSTLCEFENDVTG